LVMTGEELLALRTCPFELRVRNSFEELRWTRGIGTTPCVGAFRF